MGIDRGGYSPGILQKIVYAGVTSPSFKQASKALTHLADVHVPTKQVERLTQSIGQELCVQRDAQVQEYQALPLVDRKSAPQGVEPPSLAVVGVDGGRIQILDRSGSAPEEADQKLDPQAMQEETGRRGKHWREDKIGLLMTMTSEVQQTDPCPEIPATFVDATRIAKLARELKKQPAQGDDDPKKPAEPPGDSQDGVAKEAIWKPPKVEEKRFVASRCRWPDFGPILATSAWMWGFYAAERKVFIGDGSDHHWGIWRSHFSSFTAILDFIHALSYIFAAAMAGRPFAEGWPLYVQWISWTWAGQVDKVIEVLAELQTSMGRPEEGESETSPRKIVAASLTYLRNHRDQMHYAEYRRQGMPITSSYVESGVKQFNQRVKGTEKFWSEEGAEAILQLRADYLSENEPLTTFWENRENSATGQNHCCTQAA